MCSRAPSTEHRACRVACVGEQREARRQQRAVSLGLCVLLVRCLVLLVTTDRSLGPLVRWADVLCGCGPQSCAVGALVLWSAVSSSASCCLPCHQLRACVYQTRDRETRGRETRGRETRDERRESRGRERQPSKPPQHTSFLHTHKPHTELRREGSGFGCSSLSSSGERWVLKLLLQFRRDLLLLQPSSLFRRRRAEEEVTR